MKAEVLFVYVQLRLEIQSTDLMSSPLTLHSCSLGGVTKVLLQKIPVPGPELSLGPKNLAVGWSKLLTYLVCGFVCNKHWSCAMCT